MLALVFALASAAAAGAGYGWVTQPNAAALRDRESFAEIIAQRMATMTAAERRQFDALMKSPTSAR